MKRKKCFRCGDVHECVPRRKTWCVAKRVKGKMCRPDDRDEAEKAKRGYVEAGSYVRRDGSEKLVGKDWWLRKQELWARLGGFCERFNVLGRIHAEGCDGKGTEPHHIVRRSIRRDDRLQNLANLSHACHAAEDPRKIGGRAA